MRILDLQESLKLLERYKIPTARSKFARDVHQAEVIAHNIGFPITLKLVSKDVIHKTDVGAIITGIEDENHLKESYKKILNNVKKEIGNFKFSGMLVQETVEKGQEVIIGGKKDPQFGEVIMFGLGGIFVEVLKDVSFRVVPIERSDAEEMVSEIKGNKILNGYRGKNYDVKSLIEALMKTSKMLAEKENIIELDINPLFLTENKIVAVDARIAVDD